MGPQEYEALLNDVEVRLERLRALYEQWFQGVERLEPTVPAKELERRMMMLRKAAIRTTALRFRFQTLWQRYTTFQQYWRRVARQIEEGTYRRDLMRARARREQSRLQREGRASDGAAPAIDLDIDIDVEVDVEGALAEAEAAVAQAPPSTAPTSRPQGSPLPPPASKPPRPFVSPFSRPPRASVPPAAGGGPLPATPRPASGGRPLPPTPKPAPALAKRPVPPPVPGKAAPVAPGPPPPPGGVAAKPPPAPVGRRPGAAPPPPPGSAADDGVRALCRQYVEARRKNNERVDNLRYESVERSIRAMLPKLRAKHGQGVGFEVVVRDGRVGLKPVPKK
jgi:hypothetical protein